MGVSSYGKYRGRGYSWACLCDDSVRRFRQAGGGVIHGRVFVTTVYDTTGIEGAGLFIGVSLLLQCYYSARRDRQAEGGVIHGRVFVTTVFDATGMQGAGLFMGVSLLPQCTTRQAVRGRGYSWACLCYYSVRRERQTGAGLFMDVSSHGQYTI